MKITIKKSIETKTYLVIENETHKIKFDEEKLDELKSSKSFEEIKKLIQKRMKQTVDKSTGEWWEESWKTFFKELTGQKLLEDFNETEEQK